MPGGPRYDDQLSNPNVIAQEPGLDRATQINQVIWQIPPDWNDDDMAALPSPPGGYTWNWDQNPDVPYLSIVPRNYFSTEPQPPLSDGYLSRPGDPGYRPGTRIGDPGYTPQYPAILY